MRWIIVFLLLVTQANAAFLFSRGGGGSSGGGGGPLTVYVAPTGNDSTGTGTIGAPFLTIGRAQTAVRAQPADATVYLRNGTYPITNTLSFISSDSGTAGHSVTWSSYPSEVAHISGGQAITGWTLHDAPNNIWQATVGTGWNFRELYVNGNARTRSYAVRTGGNWTQVTGGYTGANVISSSWGNITDVETITLGTFSMTICKVASVSGSTVTMQQPCWANYLLLNAIYYNGSTGWPYKISNAYELLAGCGQGCWYLDRTAGIVYYIPVGAEDMTTVSVVAPKVETLLSAVGLSYVTFNRLAFEYGGWTGPDNNGDGYTAFQAGYQCNHSGQCPYNTPNPSIGVPLPGQVTFSGSSHHITLQHNLFTHLASRALYLEHGSQDFNILANKFGPTGGGSMQIGDATDYGQTNAALQTQRILIKNNSIDMAFEYIDAGALFLVYAANSTIDHNEILGSQSWGLIWDWGWADVTGSTYNGYNNYGAITNNYVANYCQDATLGDCGGIYTENVQGTSLGSGLLVDSNYVHTGGAYSGSAIFCLYRDNASGYVTDQNNVCDNITPSTRPFLFWHDATNNLAQHNWYTGTGTAAGGGGSGNVDAGNNTSFTNGSPPSGALAIINAAGVQAGVTPGP